jgi:hypothetical protein
MLPKFLANMQTFGDGVEQTPSCSWRGGTVHLSSFEAHPGAVKRADKSFWSFFQPVLPICLAWQGGAAKRVNLLID